MTGSQCEIDNNNHCILTQGAINNYIQTLLGDDGFIDQQKNHMLTICEAFTQLGKDKPIHKTPIMVENVFDMKCFHAEEGLQKNAKSLKGKVETIMDLLKNEMQLIKDHTFSEQTQTTLKELFSDMGDDGFTVEKTETKIAGLELQVLKEGAVCRTVKSSTLFEHRPE